METVFDLAMFLCECEFCLCVSGSVAHFTVAMQVTIDYIPEPWPFRLGAFRIVL